MSNKRLNVFKRLGSATDARQLLTRSNSNEKVVVVTGIKDAKVQHGKVKIESNVCFSSHFRSIRSSRESINPKKLLLEVRQH